MSNPDESSADPIIELKSVLESDLDENSGSNTEPASDIDSRSEADSDTDADSEWDHYINDPASQDEDAEKEDGGIQTESVSSELLLTPDPEPEPEAGAELNSAPDSESGPEAETDPGTGMETPASDDLPVIEPETGSAPASEDADAPVRDSASEALPDIPFLSPDADMGGMDDMGMIDAVPLKLDEIHTLILSLQKTFDAKIKDDGVKARTIDNLHRELQDYKNDFLKSYLKSMVMDLIQYTDNIRKLSNFYHGKEKDDIDPKKILGILENIPSDLEDLCARQGIFPYNQEDETFDPTRQRVLKRLETDNEELDKTVAERIHPGYEWDGAVIRPEIVTVYAYKAPSEQ